MDGTQHDNADRLECVYQQQSCAPSAMKAKNDQRSWLKRKLSLLRLKTDSGFIVLAAVGIAAVLLSGIRLYRHPTNASLSAIAGKELPKTYKGEIHGLARVIDGDTLEISGQRIRLFGIDAPEHGQVCRNVSNIDYGCGIKASAEVDGLVSGQVISCQPRSRDKYGRVVAVCLVAGQDLGNKIVAEGWAVAFERYSRDYVDEQTLARERHLGLWQGSFDSPSDVRAHNVTRH